MLQQQLNTNVINTPEHTQEAFIFNTNTTLHYQFSTHVQTHMNIHRRFNTIQYSIIKLNMHVNKHKRHPPLMKIQRHIINLTRMFTSTHEHTQKAFTLIQIQSSIINLTGMFTYKHTRTYTEIRHSL